MSSSRQKVVHVISKFSRECWGGAETALLNVCPRLAEHGFDCEVWSPMVFSSTREEVMEGVRVRRFPGFYLGGREEKLAGRGKAQISPSLLWRTLVTSDINLIHLHCHNRLASVVASCASLRGVPLVITLHSSYRPLRPRWRYYFPLEYAIRKADKVITVSEALGNAVRHALPDLSPDKFMCIRNGAAFSSANGRGRSFRERWELNGAPLLLVVGRICQTKNQELLVRILPAVERHVPGVKLAIVGPPADEAYYRRLVEQIAASPCRPNIRLIPGLPPESEELRDAYRAADVLVLPSLEEGAVPLVVLEAWAAAVPVVASSVFPNPELIADQRNGRLFDLDNAEEELPRQIVELLGRPDWARTLGEAGRRTVRTDYTWDAIATQLAAAYDSVLQRRNGNGR